MEISICGVKEFSLGSIVYLEKYYLITEGYECSRQINCQSQSRRIIFVIAVAYLDKVGSHIQSPVCVLPFQNDKIFNHVVKKIRQPHVDKSPRLTTVMVFDPFSRPGRTNMSSGTPNLDMYKLTYISYKYKDNLNYSRKHLRFLVDN